MIFKPELVRQILVGRKTQTRRPLKGNASVIADALLADHDTHEQPNDACPLCLGEPVRRPPCSYRQGRTYALQRPKRRDEMRPDELLRVDEHRGRPPKIAVGRLHITAVRLERAGAISFADARAEGFRTTDDFKAYWTRLHDARWFIVPGTVTTERERTPEEIAARFIARHADTPVWAITFELEQPRPRFLAVRSELGYVESTHDHRGRQIALLDELPDDVGTVRREGVEAVDETALAAFARDAHARDVELAEQREAERETLSIDERVGRLRIASWTKGIDVARDISRIQATTDRETQLRCLRAAERKVWPSPTAAAA